MNGSLLDDQPHEYLQRAGKLNIVLVRRERYVYIESEKPSQFFKEK